MWPSLRVILCLETMTLKTHIGTIRRKYIGLYAFHFNLLLGMVVNDNYTEKQVCCAVAQQLSANNMVFVGLLAWQANKNCGHSVIEAHIRSFKHIQSLEQVLQISAHGRTELIHHSFSFLNTKIIEGPPPTTSFWTSTVNLHKLDGRNWSVYV